MHDLNSIRLNVRHCRSREDEPGTSWGPRSIADYELLLVCKGEYTYSDANGERKLKKGDLLQIEPGIEHSFAKDNNEHGRHYSTHFDLIDSDGHICFLRKLNCIPTQNVYSSPVYVRHIFEMASHQFASRGKFHQEAVNSAVRAIWLLLAETWFNAEGPQVSERVERMMDYLRNHIEQSITRVDLAHEFHCTPEHINYLFKKELGESPTRFINRERTLKAFHLMERDGLNVQEAALRTGFSSQYYFSRVFKSFFGYPPSHVKLYRSEEIDRIFKKNLPYRRTDRA